eukprot:TRINITY_DN106011_c0_g1_i1.p1 TRINITY_DN106011_c0_g1~~TRINITY_DN106011_c0_g1_i1.p1  ORF type:complete len:164 (+),score=3.45 TRINITY_DN106011_c0_g1_i1:25-516(+)
MADSSSSSTLHQRRSYNETTTNNDEPQSEKSSFESGLEKVKDFLVGLFWIGLSAFVTLQSDIVNVAFNNPKTNSNVLYVGIACLLLSWTAGLYAVIYVAWYKGIRLDYPLPGHPYCIPIASAFGVAAFILFIVALWPIFHVLTPVIIFVMFMGFLYLTAMLGI